MALDALRIAECPAAFAEFALKHNRLVDILERAVGENGIAWAISENNLIVRGNVANSNVGGGGSIANLAFASVVTSDGRLQNVLSNTNVTSSYPATGKWVTASGNVTIDATGLTITKSGGSSVTIAFASIARAMSIGSVAVCNNNAAASMDGLFSASY